MSILQRMSAIFTHSHHKNLVTARFSSLVHCSNEATMLETAFLI